MIKNLSKKEKAKIGSKAWWRAFWSIILASTTVIGVAPLLIGLSIQDEAMTYTGLAMLFGGGLFLRTYLGFVITEEDRERKALELKAG